MVRSKRTARTARSGKAHRRYTKAEVAGIDHTRRAVADGGLQTLVEFANHTERPWSSLWAGIASWQIHGEPFTEEAADELQQYLQPHLLQAVRGRFSFGSFGVDITVTYRAVNNRVTVEGPQDNLNEVLDWLLLETIRSGQIKRLKRCRWRDCARFFLADRSTKRCCSPSCQDAVSNAQRSAKRRANRERSRRYYNINLRGARSLR